VRVPWHISRFYQPVGMEERGKEREKKKKPVCDGPSLSLSSLIPTGHQHSITGPSPQ